MLEGGRPLPAPLVSAPACMTNVVVSSIKKKWWLAIVVITGHKFQVIRKSKIILDFI
jgi:hypothetical protein